MEPAEHETAAIYDPALVFFNCRVFIAYNDASGHTGGERLVLQQPHPGPPLNGRLRSAQIHQEENTVLLLCGASLRPEIIIRATAELPQSAE